MIEHVLSDISTVHQSLTEFSSFQQLSSISPMAEEDSLEDLSDVVGDELASLDKETKTSKQQQQQGGRNGGSNGAGSNGNSSSSGGSSSSSSPDIPADISDLRSSDLLQTQPWMQLDIDRIFADVQQDSGAQQV